MLLSIAKKLLGSNNERTIKKLMKTVEAINEKEPQYESMSDEEIRAQTTVLRNRLESNPSHQDAILIDAFAVVREAAKRTLGQRHFDEQLLGGIVLHSGRIAEMKTGEGKTLVSTLAVYLNALSGKGVHIVTVNDYLASRDAEWMGSVYKFLGLSVGCIIANIPDEDRRKAYQADITYGTNNEFGFDYLRDNMKFNLKDMVQRPFNFAIIDEVDSILIDEARTPLIISGPSEGSVDLYRQINSVIPKLDKDCYEVDEKLRTVTFTEDGMEKLENTLREEGILEEGNLYDIQNVALVHHVNQALRAHKLFAKDKDYVIKDNKVIIVDEFTGRMMEGRRYSEGLHQALEAKEGVAIQMENQTLASITFQNYFRLYPKLAGMTGTAMTEEAEFMEIYGLSVVEIPTHKSIARLDHNDKIFKSLAEKEDAIIKLIDECHQRQQPVLVGTVSIEKSETLAVRLKKHKIPHNVLNARYHEQEATIIAQAGKPGAVTIATNMAGRGTDIQLGGNAEMLAMQQIEDDWTEEEKSKTRTEIEEQVRKDKDTVKEAGGLYVIGTERHESRRIDNQLRGRSGRQGDPGASMFFLSLEDDLMRIFGAQKMEAVLANKQIGLQEGEALTHPWLSKALERAQAKVEAQNFEIRKNLLKFDNVMNDQRKVIYDQRKDIMQSSDISELVNEMRHDVIHELVNKCIPPKAYPEQWDVKTLKSEIQRIFMLDLPVEEWAKEEGIADQEILERINDAADRKMAEKIATAGKDAFLKVEKALVLQLVDQHWKEHLLSLDHLRQGINLRAFGQRDPLNEYKAEAFSLFEAMLDTLRENITHTLMIIDVNINQGLIEAIQGRSQEQEMQETRKDPALSEHSDLYGQDETSITAQGSKKPFDQGDPETWGKVQRNSPCPCGSGKKYKHCHGKIAQMG